MALDLSTLTKSRAVKAPRILLYGVPGIGKSTFAASADAVAYQATEDPGPIEAVFLRESPESDIVANSLDQVIEHLGALYTQDHPFKTYALDSLSAIERMIHAQVDATYSEKDRAYGKNYVLAQGYWLQLFAGLDAIRNTKGMAILLIAHCEVEKFQNPDGDSYDQYRPALHKTASKLVREWCDAVLFVNYRTFITTEDAGFNKKRNRGVGQGQRVIFTQERPAYLAKNRYGLPLELPFEWGPLMEGISGHLSN